MEQAGKVAIVTGAGSGIGKGIAARLAEDGFTVVISDRNEQAGREAAGQMPKSRFIFADVADKRSVDRLFGQVAEQLGRIDVLVNNAGISRHRESLRLSVEDWTDSIDVMLHGVFYCSQAAGQAMVSRGGGAIVNIASINSVISIPGRLGYSCAKSAVLAMTRILAAEWAPYRIRVNALSPGVTRTPLMEESVRSGMADEQSYLSRIPLGRLAEVEEIAAAAAFLVSDQASYITGNNLIVDGGWTSYHWTDLNHEAALS